MNVRITAADLAGAWAIAATRLSPTNSADQVLEVFAGALAQVVSVKAIATVRPYEREIVGLGRVRVGIGDDLDWTVDFDRS